ncbi:hypothetical protein [Flavihumibacter fluvii]|uniref:hypothetical protein n=1 Tax=Flavihumibacter fluvii TaxID=2838157 RepID=UPI001BDE1EEC|nr:hypothetical protein [Flavihumibacter fluvii]ULQ51718.1 hypothetical protein KJS93_16645 [Flavihumibacter fluvii]
MNAFQQYVKKLEANPNIPPEIAHFFKLGFLKIELTRAEGKEFDTWLYATITPHSIELLDKFFQHTVTAEEMDELDEWLQESAANDQLFNLLLELDFKQTSIESIPMLSKLLSREETGIFPV